MESTEKDKNKICQNCRFWVNETCIVSIYVDGEKYRGIASPIKGNCYLHEEI